MGVGIEPCDRSNSLQFRHRHHKLLGSGWDADNIISASAAIQGGWPYRQSTGSGLQPVLYDEPCSYKRFSAGESLRLRRSFDNFRITSVSALQLMYDSMHIDNDFSPPPVFTLTQTQRQIGLTQETMAVPREQTGNWNHITGAFLHAKYNQMSAPVTMKRAGIEDLIPYNDLASYESYAVSGFTGTVTSEKLSLSMTFATPLGAAPTTYEGSVVK